MSITVNTSRVANLDAAWRPIIWKVSSDRYAGTVKSVTSVSSGTGGYARYAITGNPYLVGDIVTGSDFTTDSTPYNIRQTVMVRTGSYIETDVLFITLGTGAGTMTRTNDNFQVKCETVVYGDSKLTINSVTDSGGGIIALNYTTHNYSANDFIYVEGTTSYNGVYKVVSVTGTTIVSVTATYVADETGESRKGTIVGTKRQLAITDSGNIRFKLNCSGHLQTALNPDLIDGSPTSIQTPTSNTIKIYSINFTEEFDDVNGLLKSVDSTLTDVAYAIRAVWQHKEKQSLADYIMGSSSQKFLSKSPLIQKIRIGEEYQLSFLVSGSVAPTYKIRTENFNINNASIVVYTTSGVTIVDDRAVAPLNTSLISIDTVKTNIWLVDGSGTQMSEKRTFVIDRNSYQNPIRFYFENTLGGFDAYTFTGNLSKNVKSSKTTFTKNLDVSFSIKDRGVTDLGIISSTANEIFSNLLTNAEALWLKELINSSNVYIKAIGDSGFTPVNIYTDSQLLYDSDVPTQYKIVYSESNNDLSLNN